MNETGVVVEADCAAEPQSEINKRRKGSTIDPNEPRAGKRQRSTTDEDEKDACPCSLSDDTIASRTDHEDLSNEKEKPLILSCVRCKERRNRLNKPPEEKHPFRACGLIAAFLCGHDMRVTAELVYSMVEIPTFVMHNQHTLTFPEKIVVHSQFLPKLLLLMSFVEEEHKAKRVEKKSVLEQGEEDLPCIAWVVNGSAIFIKNQQELVDNVIPRFFSTTRVLQSFTRKLYRWGFRRKRRVLVTSSPNIDGTEVDNDDESSIGAKPDDDDEIIFAHPYFVKGQKCLMAQMRSETGTWKNSRKQEESAPKAVDRSHKDKNTVNKTVRHSRGTSVDSVPCLSPRQRELASTLPHIEMPTALLTATSHALALHRFTREPALPLGTETPQFEPEAQSSSLSPDVMFGLIQDYQGRKILARLGEVSRKKAELVKAAQERQLILSALEIERHRLFNERIKLLVTGLPEPPSSILPSEINAIAFALARQRRSALSLSDYNLIIHPLGRDDLSSSRLPQSQVRNFGLANPNETQSSSTIVRPEFNQHQWKNSAKSSPTTS